VLAALRATRADAVWPGWGFLAEDPSFVEKLEAAEIQFLGPSAETIRRLGDKITSKRIAEAAHVPVSPWSGGAVQRLELPGYARIGPGDAEGDRGWRRPRNPHASRRRRPARRVRQCAGRGVQRLRRRNPLRREDDLGRAPRRGADGGRPPRDRARAGTARLLGAAEAPEGRRGGPPPASRSARRQLREASSACLAGTTRGGATASISSTRQGEGVLLLSR
jgi:hypothetical protein